MRHRLSRLAVRPSLAGCISAVVVGLSILLVVSQLRPDLLFLDSTAAGGDMGAHVWAPQYLIEHLLPHGRLTGWSPDWYAGFPALHFYFPLPTIAIALMSAVMPMTIAFKLVSVSGMVTLPLAAYIFGRLAGFPFPVPACLAAFTVPFLFSTGFSILGGNMASTLAGEFSFSIALSISLVLLGLVARGVRTGEHQGLASLVFGALIMTHVLPTIFAFVASLLIILVATVAAIPRGRSAVLAPIKWAVPVGAVGGLVSAWWLIPFIWQSSYMNDMGWEKIGTGVEAGLKVYDEKVVNYSDALFPGAIPWQQLFTGVAAPGPMQWFTVVAAIAALLVLCSAVYSIAMSTATKKTLEPRHQIGIVLVLIAVIAAIGFVYMPQGRLWNARLLPFWFLSLYLLTGLFIGELGRLLARAIDSTKQSVAAADVADGVRITAPLVALAVAFAVVVPTLPKPGWWNFSDAPWYQADSGKTQSFIPGWVAWNYSGYDGQRSDGTYYKDSYPEFESLIDMLGNAGKTFGCGRVMWEYDTDQLNRFGTPMALMRAPSLTDGCMGSMEGLYFESSPTVPYHFLNQRELSLNASQPMRDMPYASGLNVLSGIDKMQLMGVKYYLSFSPESQQQAALDPRLTLVASMPTQPDGNGTERVWNLYEIAGTDLVAPLANLPNVMTDPKSIPTWRDGRIGKDHSEREAWLENSLAWYGNATNFDVPLAANGPANWPRIANATETYERVPTEPVNIDYIATGDDRITFKVDRPGIPVVVKASYFPNWRVEGASGPFRVSPNQMVVVPTDNTVSLYYGRTPIDVLSAAGTGLGLGLVGWMVLLERRRRLEAARVDQVPASGSPPEPPTADSAVGPTDKSTDKPES